MNIQIKLTRAENLARFNVPKNTVVTLDMETEYLPVVVASEVYENNGRTPMEAKKAQAVAARTYVAAHALAGTVIDDTANYQAFSFKNLATIPNSAQAVRETAGQVLMCQSKMITAWYSNSNGGRTKRSDEAWSSYKPWTVAKDDPWDALGRAKWGECKASHCVGMSQIGAAYAAYEGKQYTDIIGFYYADTDIVAGYGESGVVWAHGGDTVDGIRAYPITQDFHTKNDCYKAARVREKTHIIVHSTAAKGPAYIPRWQQWNTPDFQKCAHAFVDWNGIYQTLPWAYQGWLNGVRAGNDCSIAFEICEPLEKNDTPEMAADLYGKTLYLCAYLCREYGIPPERVICHAEANRLGLANAHADVTHWWGKKGTAWEPYTMARLREDVAAALGVVSGFPYEALVVTTTTPLNIWSDTKKTERNAQVAKGDTLTVTGNAEAAGWFKVRKGTVEGFADGKYLLKIESDTGDEGSGMGGEEEEPEDTGEAIENEMVLVPVSELERLLGHVDELAAQVDGRMAELAQTVRAWVKGSV